MAFDADDITSYEPEVLLSTFASLTHQIHDGERDATYVADYDRVNEIRAKRDLVKNEILRRMS